MRFIYSTKYLFLYLAKDENSPATDIPTNTVKVIANQILLLKIKSRAAEMTKLIKKAVIFFIILLLYYKMILWLYSYCNRFYFFLQTICILYFVK